METLAASLGCIRPLPLWSRAAGEAALINFYMLEIVSGKE